MSASEMTDGPQSLLIDFMYLDLTTCDRCLGTERNLEAALEKVRDALATTGARVEIRRTLVETEAQARELAFVSSPTIRINGQDIALETQESTCGACSDICDTDTECRVWVHQGTEYTEAPVGMIVDAMLRVVYGGSHAAAGPPAYEGVPENLRTFYARKGTGAAPSSAECCGDGTSGASCSTTNPSAATSCCGSE